LLRWGLLLRVSGRHECQQRRGSYQWESGSHGVDQSGDEYRR